MTVVIVSPGCGTKESPIELWVGADQVYEPIVSTSPADDTKAIVNRLLDIKATEVMIDCMMPQSQLLAVLLEDRLPKTVKISLGLYTPRTWCSACVK